MNRELPNKIENSIMLVTFGSQYAMEQAISKMKELSDVTWRIIDGWTLVVRFDHPKDNALRKKVSELILSSSGYIEKDLSLLTKKKSKGGASPLDYPIFG